MMPDTLEAMLHGPGRARFILQPLIAIVLGVKDGRFDAVAGRPAYLYALAFSKDVRREEVTTAVRTISKPLAVAVALDAVLQYVILDAIHLWQALGVGATLVALPYVAARALADRLLRRRAQSADRSPTATIVRSPLREASCRNVQGGSTSDQVNRNGTT